jgi:hypothetical protein
MAQSVRGLTSERPFNVDVAFVLYRKELAQSRAQFCLRHLSLLLRARRAAFERVLPRRRNQDFEATTQFQKLGVKPPRPMRARPAIR